MCGLVNITKNTDMYTSVLYNQLSDPEEWQLTDNGVAKEEWDEWMEMIFLVVTTVSYNLFVILDLPTFWIFTRNAEGQL